MQNSFRGTFSGWDMDEIISTADNRKRKVIHQLPECIHADSLKIIIESTNGSRRAELIEKLGV